MTSVMVNAFSHKGRGLRICIVHQKYIIREWPYADGKIGVSVLPPVIPYGVYHCLIQANYLT